MNRRNFKQHKENIEYLGTVSDSELKKLRSNAVACVVPNIYLENEDDFEAFCFVTIEAVASASIVVASDYQGISEALLGGNLGYLAKPSDINSWVDILKEVISLKENERNELIKKITITKKEMTWEILFKQTKAYYEKIILN